MAMHYSVSALKQELLSGTFPAMVPLGAAAEVLGLTKSSLLRKAGTETSRLELMSITAATGTVWNGVTAKSLTEELDYQQNHRPRTAQLALRRLELLAKAGQTSEYGDFMNDIGLSWRNPHHRALTGQLLGQISSSIYDRYKLLPSVLVVNKASQRPSDPFFQLARDLQAYNPKKQTDAVFFEMMKANVFAHATRGAVWEWRDELGE